MRIVMKRTGKNSLIRIVAFVAALLLTVSLHSIMSFAAAYATIDTSVTGSLTVKHVSVDNELMEGVISHLYLVATIDEKGQYTITDDFKGFFEDQDFFNNGYDYDAWKSCVAYQEVSDSDNLLEYIEEKGIAEAASGVSDASGKTYYKGLKLGVYYVLSDKVVKGDYTHSFVNFVYPVPILQMSKDSAQIEVNYNPEVSPKKSKIENTVMTHCHILKRWNDSGNSDKRPSFVTFEIYCDDELMKTVELSDANNWYFEWENEGVHSYKVKEIAAGAGYVGDIQIFQDGTHFQFICTNTYTPPETPPGNPPETPETPPETPGIPDLPEVLGALRDLPEVLGARRLPQTGQLWWPLPVLVIAGVLLIVKGIRKNNSKAL